VQQGGKRRPAMTSGRDRLKDLDRFYKILETIEHNTAGKRILSACHANMKWPRRGVYFFFEDGEYRQNGYEPRVVRVGTHALKRNSGTTLWDRLQGHKGTERGKYPGGGNHRGSIFRLHVGTALINRDGLCFDSWGRGSSGGADIRVKEHPLEIRVSEIIRAMPFVLLEVDDEPGPNSMRKCIEKNSIALLSNFKRAPIDPASPGWLGQYFASYKVRESGLWNVEHVDERYDPGFLDILFRLVDENGNLFLSYA